MLSLLGFVLFILGCGITTYGVSLLRCRPTQPPFLKTRRSWHTAAFATSVLAILLTTQYLAVNYIRQGKPRHKREDSDLKRLGWQYGCRGTDVGFGASKARRWEEEVARDEDITQETLGYIFDNARRWAGVSFDRCEMLRFMETVAAQVLAPLKDEWKIMLKHYRSDMFGMQDAKILYAMIRGLRPARVVEIGSGHSTIVGASAATTNAVEGTPTRYEIIEPFPSRVPPNLTGLCQPGCIKQEFLESVPLSHFLSLRRGDILFVDSSHLVGRHYDLLLGRTNNSRDVAVEFTEVLPRLQPGVIVHIHDIPFPAHAWFSNSTPGETPRGYAEQFFLQALLQHSDLLRPLWFGGALAASLHTRMGVPPDELDRAKKRARQVFGKQWAGGDTSRPFGGGGSVWLLRTEVAEPPHLPPWRCAAANREGCSESQLSMPPETAKLGDVLDQYRSWYGVQLPEVAWPHSEGQGEEAGRRAHDSLKTAGDKVVCRVLQQLRSEQDGLRGSTPAASEAPRNGRTVLEIGGAAGSEPAGRWEGCGAGSHIVQQETRGVVLASILGLAPGDVLVYGRSRDEARGTPATDGFIVFVTEALPRVPPEVVVVILGVPFPRHEDFEAQTATATDDTQFLIQAALIYNRRLKVLSASHSAIVLRTLQT